MNGIGHDAEETRRLTLALLLALGLHAALLLGVPADGWLLRHVRPLRLSVAILPPMERPILPVAAPGPVESAIQPGPAATVLVAEPAPPLPESPTVPPPSPAPVLTPSPSPSPTPPPQPVIATRPAPKAVAPAPKPAPAAPPKPAKAPVSPAKPATPPSRTTTAASSGKPSLVKPPPAPRLPPPETPRPSPENRTAAAAPSGKPLLIKPPPAPRLTPPETPRPSPENRIGRSERGVGAGTGASSRPDSTALLGQIAGLDAENQRRISSSSREQRVSLADTYSLAGFYAADWARKVTRVGEMNFPDAARRSNPGAGPLLEVAIQADGRLRSVRVLRSSGNAELDQAARRIVELAAPYPAFPSELRRQVEVLRIEAPWRFDPGGRVRVR